MAKASLYNTFGSKDELVRAYLDSRHGARQRILHEVDRFATPRERLLGVFDCWSGRVDSRIPRVRVRQRQRRGPSRQRAEQAADEYRDWIRGCWS